MRRNSLLIIGILAATAIAGQCFAGPKKAFYAKVGGIHRIANAIDMCVEMEAKDPILNKNPRFKMAYQIGKPFCKFAITNTVAAGAGGPQKVVFSVAPITKWINLSKAESDRAWSIREKAFMKAGIPRANFLQMKSWYMKAEMMAKPMQPSAETFKNKDSLYARLGGIVAITMVVDDFVNMLATDPTLSANKHVAKSLMSGKVTGPGLKYLLAEQIAQAAGGPYKYSGQSMKQAHKNLMITEKEWKVGAGIFKKVLDKYNVPAREQGELFQAIAATHKDIVRG